MPGLALFYSELVQGIPLIFKHYVANVPALHSVLVFVSIKSLPIGKVPIEERFLFRRVKPNDQNVFRCVVRYGYTDMRNDQQEPFETMLVERLKEFIIDDFWFSQNASSNINAVENDGGSELDGVLAEDGERENHHEDTKHDEAERLQEEVEKEIEGVEKAWRAGIVHLIGENEVVAGKGAGLGKRFLINYGYNFLKKNLRQTENVYDIPHKRMLKVGMTYEL